MRDHGAGKTTVGGSYLTVNCDDSRQSWKNYQFKGTELMTQGDALKWYVDSAESHIGGTFGTYIGVSMSTINAMTLNADGDESVSVGFGWL